MAKHSLEVPRSVDAVQGVLTFIPLALLCKNLKKAAAKFESRDLRMKKTACSVLVHSPFSEDTAAFVKQVSIIWQRAVKVDIGPPRTIVRMDYIHRNEEDAKVFINKVKGLKHSRTTIIHTALARKQDLYPSEKPIISENDFIKFCIEANSFNICSGYQIKVIFSENESQFEFSSWNELNLFIFEATREKDFNRAFLGLLSEDNENAHNEESRRQTIKTVTVNNDLIYPLKVAFGSGMCRNDLENIAPSSKFSIHKVDEDSKVASLGFKTKADLYKFITSDEAKRFSKVNILNGGSRNVKEDVISKEGGRGGGGGQGRGSRDGRGGGGRGEFGGRGGGPGGGGQGGGGDNRGRGSRGTRGGGGRGGFWGHGGGRGGGRGGRGGGRGGFGGRGGSPGGGGLGGGGRGGGQGGRGGGGGGNRGRGGMM